jgi:hypothetical protein
MIIIKKHGKYIKEITCPLCECVFLYNSNSSEGDLKYPTQSFWDDDGEYISNKRYVKCPECGHLIWEPDKIAEANK